MKTTFELCKSEPHKLFTHVFQARGILQIFLCSADAHVSCMTLICEPKRKKMQFSLDTITLFEGMSYFFSATLVLEEKTHYAEKLIFQKCDKHPFKARVNSKQERGRRSRTEFVLFQISKISVFKRFSILRVKK